MEMATIQGVVIYFVLLLVCTACVETYFQIRDRYLEWLWEDEIQNDDGFDAIDWDV